MTPATLPAPAAAALSALLDKLAAGDLSPLVSPYRFTLPAGAPAGKWSLLNRALAFAQTASLDCRGYRQWQQVGRQVKSGSHCARIFVPRLVADTRTDAAPDDVRLAGWLTAAVFPLESTDGPTPPEYQPRTLPPLASLADRLGVSVTYTPTPDRINGCYDPKTRSIVLGTDDPHTYLHELAHAVDATLRPLKGGAHDDQEAPAELAAAVLCALYLNEDRSGDAAARIAHMPADAALRYLGQTSAILARTLELAAA